MAKGSSDEGIWHAQGNNRPKNRQKDRPKPHIGGPSGRKKQKRPYPHIGKR